jgi:mutual gliding-motility protein MglA
MISLATETERTLFFDFLPARARTRSAASSTRFHLYTVPGQVFYDASRKLILRGVDGVVFVADSQIERMEANIESLDNLRRDLPDVMPIEQLDADLNRLGVSTFEASAIRGEGVFETLKALSKSVLRKVAEQDPAAAKPAASPPR